MLCYLVVFKEKTMRMCMHVYYVILLLFVMREINEFQHRDER